MSSDVLSDPDGTESPVERTDPLLPVVSPGVPPLGRALDDRTLASLLAELDDDDAPAAPSAPAPATAAPAPATAAPAPATAAPGPATAAPGPAAAAPAPAAAVPDPRPPVAHPALPALPARPPARRANRDSAPRYVRREYRPPPAETPGLTWLSRRAGGRVGSIVFTAVFLAIFLLILVQTVVSLLAAV